MSAIHTEKCLEDAIEQDLLADGYVQRGEKGFHTEHALFPQDVYTWVKDSQPKTWQNLQKVLGTDAEVEKILLGDLLKELAASGSLHVLRHGFKCYGKKIAMAVFSPASDLNPQTLAQYKANICAVARQIPCKPGTKDSIDMVLAVNGIPVVTLELKNAMTGQTVQDARKQYEDSRDAAAPLFRFKERALVHFAVDADEVYLCTRLQKKESYWLPFNKGHNLGKGNPPSTTGGYRTAYLWQEALSRDSLLDILARYIHIEKSSKKIVQGNSVKTITKEVVIFPRYHQLSAVRKLTGHAYTHGSGHNYLVQHSAGSGKSNTIGWLAHHLASLHGEDNKKIFHSVVVVTDRVVIDRQLQETIYQFEHKRGVVQKIDKDTKQLAKALASGVSIIISTIHKFSFITSAIQRLLQEGEEIEISTQGKRFAIIIDEAHSSQSGETAMELRRILNKDGIESVVAEQLLADDDKDMPDEAKARMYTEQAGRMRQPNLSYFAFTATPKFKTLAVFNEAGDNGKAPFHHYSMRQAIEEKFILDVLAHYVPYKKYFGLVKAINDDPNVPKRKAARALARFVGLHPHNIRQQVEVIVEHFRSSTLYKIGGRAKAMVVTESRLHAVRYKLSLDAYLQEQGYTDMRTLVAFSGEVHDLDNGEKYTEPAMNKGLKEKELPERFEGDEFNVLIVADKYQTGFDQPLLHTMYVDKKLGGVQAVQTLSRLNRCATGKVDTFVLDFRNQSDDIYNAFKPYYETTPMGESVEPQRMYVLHKELLSHDVIYEEDVQDFCTIWFGQRGDGAAAHPKLNALIDVTVERFVALEDKEKDELRGKLGAFRNLYGFLSQIIPYSDSDLEKMYVFVRFLLTKLPREEQGADFILDNEVSLRYYRLEKLEEGKINLNEGETLPLKGPMETGTRSAEAEDVPLSTLVDNLNDRFGTSFTPADQLFFDQVAEAAVENAVLQEAIKVNSLDDVADIFSNILEGLFINRMEGNESIFNRVMNGGEFRKLVEEKLLLDVYSRLKKVD